MHDGYTKGEELIEILERLLFQLIPGNYNTFGQGFQWKVSRSFFDFDFSDVEIIEEEFSREYKAAVSQIQKVWGKPNFRGNCRTLGYPKWYWVQAIEMCYWKREEGIVYIAFEKEDREDPYEINLGAITETAIEEIIELGLTQSTGL